MSPYTLGPLTGLSPAAIPPPSPCPCLSWAKAPPLGSPIHLFVTLIGASQSHIAQGTFSSLPPLNVGVVFSSPTCARSTSPWRSSSVCLSQQPQFQFPTSITFHWLLSSASVPAASSQSLRPTAEPLEETRPGLPPPHPQWRGAPKDTWGGLREQAPTRRNPPCSHHTCPPWHHQGFGAK